MVSDCNIRNNNCMFFKNVKNVFLFLLMIFSCSCSKYPTNKNELEKREISHKHVENLTDSIVMVKQISTDSDKKEWAIDIELKNHGTEPLFINSVITGCSCLKSSYNDKVFRKNENSIINIVYTPIDNNDSTFFYKTIMIIFNDGKYYHAVDISNK